MTEPKDIKKIVLAYSGGLDTSIIIPWLKEQYDGAQIVCVCTNVGQEEDWAAMEQKALASGAVKLIVRDVRDEFAREYLYPMLRRRRGGTRASTYWAPASHDHCRQNTKLMWPWPKGPTRSLTAVPARVTTRSDLS